MIIDKKILDGYEIYIKRDSVSIDAMYKIGDKEESFVNYGTYYSLDLFEFGDKLYLIKRSNYETLVMPVVINYKKNYVTCCSLMHGYFKEYLSEDELENLFKNGFFR